MSEQQLNPSRFRDQVTFDKFAGAIALARLAQKVFEIDKVAIDAIIGGSF